MALMQVKVVFLSSWLQVLLPEAFEVGGPALVGRSALLCNASDVVL